MFFQILTYFVIYSFLGWVFESTVRTIYEKKIINTGFLSGPFCPIYGCGAIIMIIFFNGLKDNIFVLFLSAFIILTLWEYIVGTLLEKIFKTKYWDYSEHKLNYKGQVCLTNSLAWGVIGVLFIEYIHPFISELIGKIDSRYMTIFIIAISIALLTDAIINIVITKNIKSALQKVEDINEQIKKKLGEIKDKAYTNDSNTGIIESLKKRRDRMIRKLYRRAYRLKKAFPAIDTKEFTEILSTKIDFKRKKRKKGE